MFFDNQPGEILLPMREESLATSNLICFPYAGAAAAWCMPMFDELDQGINVYSLQLPGRGSRFNEALMEDMQDIVKEALQAIVPLMRKPTVFFGHSMGARIAYETAHHLRALGYPEPRHVICSASPPPGTSSVTHPKHQMSDPELLQHIKEMEGTPKQIIENKEFMDLLLPILRADYKVIETYQLPSRQKLRCSASVFYGDSDVALLKNDLASWEALFSGCVDEMKFNGGHFYFENGFSELVRQINLKVKRAMLSHDQEKNS